MQFSEIISSTDHETGDEAFVAVKRADASVELTLSLKSNGDVSVFMEQAEVSKLIGALRSALAVA